MAPKHLIPSPTTPFLNPDGTVSRPWYTYLGGLEEVAKRLDGVDALAGTETLGQTQDRVNEILTAYKTG